MAVARRTIAIICAGIIILACLFYILSNALPSWGLAQNGSAKATLGLWRTCGPVEGEQRCLDLGSRCSGEGSVAARICNKMMVARAFVTIACIISALAALCLLATSMITTELKRILTMVSKVLPLVSLVTGIIGVAVGIAFVTDSVFEYSLKISTAAILGIIAVVMNLIGAVLAFMIQ